MKPLTLEETKLKEEMKQRCLIKGQYTDEKAKDKFDMLCHLEDFEIQYWELEKENKQLKSILKSKPDTEITLQDDKGNKFILIQSERIDMQEKLNKTIERLFNNWNKLRTYFNERIEVCDNRLSSPFCNFEKVTKERLIFSQCLEKLEELEQGSDSNE